MVLRQGGDSGAVGTPLGGAIVGERFSFSYSQPEPKALVDLCPDMLNYLMVWK